MTRTPCFVVALVLIAGPAAAQSAIYAGGSVAADSGRHGTFDLGTFPAAGGFVGLRFHSTSAWALEIHIDRGFGAGPRRSEIEIFGDSIVEDRPGGGYSFLVAWNARQRRRVGAVVTLGISTRIFSTHRVSFRKVIPDDPYPVRDVADRDGGGGIAGGAFFPIALGGRWSLAPEVRATLGLTGEHGEYVQFYSGARLIWGF